MAAETMAAPAALVDVRSNVMIITINRPGTRNAVNGAVSTVVGDALTRAQGDRKVRVVVITGAGGKSFCAGADLKAIARGENLFHPEHGEWSFAGYVHHFIDKPTVAAVNGAALGGGAEIALASDLVVAGESASFGLPEVKRGLIAGAGGAFRLVRQLPPKLALEAMYTGEPIAARQALRWGLVNRVVPDVQGWKRLWSCRIASPSMRRCRCGPASESPIASTPASPRTRKPTGRERRANSTRCSAARTRGKGRWPSPRSDNPSGKHVEASEERVRKG